MKRNIISVLIGLVHACDSNPKTEDTDRLLIKALAFAPSDPERGETEAARLIDEIRAEKDRIAPGCALCTAPCGNTSDYDMSRIDRCEEDIRSIKNQILSELYETAAGAECLAGPEIALLYKSLSFVSYDMKKESLEALLAELKAVKHRVRGAEI